MTMMTIQSQVDTVILSLEARRLYGGPTRICNSRSGTGGRRRGRTLGRRERFPATCRPSASLERLLRAR
jgi:hypothetical protein